MERCANSTDVASRISAKPAFDSPEQTLDSISLQLFLGRIRLWGRERAAKARAKGVGPVATRVGARSTGTAEPGAPRSTSP